MAFCGFSGLWQEFGKNTLQFNTTHMFRVIGPSKDGVAQAVLKNKLTGGRPFIIPQQVRSKDGGFVSIPDHPLTSDAATQQEMDKWGLTYRGAPILVKPRETTRLPVEGKMDFRKLDQKLEDTKDKPLNDGEQNQSLFLVLICHCRVGDLTAFHVGVLNCLFYPHTLVLESKRIHNHI